MIKINIISHDGVHVASACPTFAKVGSAIRRMCVKLNEMGGAGTADAVYTNAPTQPLFAQAHSLCVVRGQRNTHGVRTNG